MDNMFDPLLDDDVEGEIDYLLERMLGKKRRFKQWIYKGIGVFEQKTRLKKWTEWFKKYWRFLMSCSDNLKMKKTT